VPQSLGAMPLLAPASSRRLLPRGPRTDEHAAKHATTTEDKGWYSHPSEWPWCSSPSEFPFLSASSASASASASSSDASLRDVWALVSSDGLLRVFGGTPRASTAALLAPARPVLGPVLSLALWPSRRIVVTLEEVETPGARASRVVRFYCWASNAATAPTSASEDAAAGISAWSDVVLELDTVPRESSRSGAAFSPMLFSLCPESDTLAAADDIQMRIYDLRDLFAPESGT